MRNYLKMAYRNLLRHRRRSALSALALAIALALLVFMAAFFKGEMRSSLEDTLRLSSGHLQVRDIDYDPDKSSVAWGYLIEKPSEVAAKIASLPPVRTATPRLFASGIVSVGQDSAGVQIIGIEPDSEANAPYRQGLVAGEFLTAEDRNGIVIGAPLAESLGLQVGSTLNLLVNTAEGTVDEQTFTVRGIFSTGSSNYDKGIVLLPLAKAQAFSGAGDRASIIFVLLEDREQAQAVASAITGAAYKVLTWQEMNELLVLVNDFSNAYITFLSLIILGVTVTVIVNTMLMAVFERTREIGILAALGMKGRQIITLFLTEAALLALGGVAVGLLAGGALSAYFGRVGIYFGDLGVSGMIFGDRIYPYLMLDDVLRLSVTAFLVTLLACLYPARLASRMEPVEALRAEK
ncbi:MAG: ABC transporter permease [Anaerolineales bacterium]|nr:ABC transporter permease [Anaerolineales bacterium]